MYMYWCHFLRDVWRGQCQFRVLHSGGARRSTVCFAIFYGIYKVTKMNLNEPTYFSLVRSCRLGTGIFVRFVSVTLYMPWNVHVLRIVVDRWMDFLWIVDSICELLARLVLCVCAYDWTLYTSLSACWFYLWWLPDYLTITTYYY